ncbi:RluA family pseudouridine synthase [Liquorilactobacillus oeni]|uniref:Pseudouridine synthase n=1 Tax=Liquorilactobacillus oeni DSM 19972 TaxID=1423777 RepID=A0A0R1MLC0_9LACO|nr:RluA family pseudouridine synthase [Liquorilactobacillus oeni]KRL04792.1 ribosomal large subunit pseudouridine synthase D [Liquorilactobacillus oeni DSM 19972]
MQINWVYDGKAPIKVKTFLKKRGVSRRLLSHVRSCGGNILLNGLPGRKVDKMNTADSLTLLLPVEKSKWDLTPSYVPLDILYEDRDFLIINKPAGVASIPSFLYPDDSLINRVWGYYLLRGYHGIIPHIATRLDRDTSGVVLIGKHRYAHSLLDEQLKKHQIKKIYLALLSGIIKADHFTLELPLGRDPKSFIKRQVILTGKRASTEMWKMAEFNDATLCKVSLHTGKTHQIRVHSAYIGHPLVGDTLYGGRIEMPLQRQALHCQKVTFFHPFKKKMIEITCGLPEDLESYFKRKKQRGGSRGREQAK